MADPYTDLGWLPVRDDWSAALEQARAAESQAALDALIQLANCRIDFAQTGRLDRAVQQLATRPLDPAPGIRPIKLAILSSCTVTHLQPGIRVGALRRGLWAEIYEAPYGMYRQELQDPASGLHRFNPDVLLLSLDARHLVGADGSTAEGALELMRDCWQLARALDCVILQQTLLPVFRSLLGNNEHRYRQSPAARVQSVNAQLRALADANGVELLAVDETARWDGIPQWHDEALWHRAKQEIHPRVAHVYGDQVGRVLAALRGRSYKCLVLDLDNTVWGGVIGDDGVAGIQLGQGNAVGEAFLAFQRYALELAGRGVILAVCSKNDEANALEAFEHHPEMLLRPKDIACFVANWNDKATNLRKIAQRLNIGLDALVFADDNPFERNLIRQELPQVAVPELPEDPACYAGCIAAAGYFEGLTVTSEDQERGAQYQANEQREQLRESVTDLGAYLTSLGMQLRHAPFDEIGMARIVQLINKTNQFNLTTRRYTQPEVMAMVSDPHCLHVQLRLLDRFGDNGIIALVIGRLSASRELALDTWLMSCRVLGRQVEAATLSVIAARARRMGATALLGEYCPSPKNGMVKDHYGKLGFELSGEDEGVTRWRLPLERFEPAPVLMNIVEGM
ncbi:MAG TPA: HAD-IIIC family phosphatase [Steroidobacteraceae bacterium]|nr:HAD-IIIC family phosphatase [Steroidobacteraceae bacterium]